MCVCVCMCVCVRARLHCVLCIFNVSGFMQPCVRIPAEWGLVHLCSSGSHITSFSVACRSSVLEIHIFVSVDYNCFVLAYQTFNRIGA